MWNEAQFIFSDNAVKMWNKAKKAKNTLFSSSNAVGCDAFLLRCFFFLSLTHAPIFRRAMLQMSWMQWNIWCIAAATFKMIGMSSARSASVLSVVKPNLSDRGHPYGVFQMPRTPAFQVALVWRNFLSCSTYNVPVRLCDRVMSLASRCYCSLASLANDRKRLQAPFPTCCHSNTFPDTFLRQQQQHWGGS